MVTVNRRFALAVLLAVLVVATVAAGVEGTGDDGSGTADGGRSSGIGFGSDTGVGSGENNGTGFSFESGESSPLIPPFLVTHAISIIMVLSVSIPIVYGVVIAWQDGIGRLLKYLQWGLTRFVIGAIAMGAILVAMFALLLLIGNGGGGLGGTNPTTTGLSGDSSGSSVIPFPSLPIPLLAVAALGAIVALVVFSDRAGSGRSIAAALAGGSSRSQQVVHDGGTNSVGTRTTFEDVEPTNEVYRAWLALARAVGATDGKQTPREVQRRAIARGLDDEAVTALTDVFREVRYSGHAPTARREQQAREAIEALDANNTVRSRDLDL